MRIIFTDKLGKMVADYENLCDMIFELNTSFDINTSWDSGEESIQYHGQDLLAEKTLSVTLNDISSQNEVRASRYLTLKNTNNKITETVVEEWGTTRHKTNLENFVLRERLVDKIGWQHYVYQADECALNGTYVQATGIESYQNDFATTTQLQVACIQWIPKTYLTFNL